MQNSDWNTANDLVKERKWNEALIAFERAFKELSEHPDFIHDRAVCLFNLGRKKEALAELNRAVGIQPDYSYRYASRAYMRNALKDIHGAIADYKKAIELDPEDAISMNNLGMLEEQLGYTQEARERFQLADELNTIMTERGISYQEERVTLRELQERTEAASSSAQDAKTEQETAKIQEVEDAENGNPKLREMAKVFRSGESFREFISFLRNGFKLGPEKKPPGDDLSR